MKTVNDLLAGGLLAVAAVGATGAQTPVPSTAASAPLTAASRAIPPRNPAVVAAENAKEPGVQRPEERVIPQLSVPLKSRVALDNAASAAPAGVPGAVNDGAARCLAMRGAAKAACERQLAASSPR